MVFANAVRRGGAQNQSEVIRHAERFAAAGYTVFAINHRQAPRPFTRHPSRTRSVRCGSFDSTRRTLASHPTVSARGDRRQAATSSNCWVRWMGKAMRRTRTR